MSADKKTMDLKNIIIKTDFRFNKRYGQNFISDTALLDNITRVAGVDKTDLILEIGVGAGTLTRSLAGKAKYVYGYEIDKNLQPVLSQTLAGVDNCLITFRDFMREDMKDVEKTIKGEYIVVANLPYYITSPIVMKLIEDAENCKRIVIMVQKEVAARFCAKENTPDYGAITCAIDVIADAKEVMYVPRSNFYPVPNVDSAVVRIDINKSKYDLKSRKAFRDVVRCAFSSRRKTFANNLMNCFKLTREQAEDLLSSVGADVKARGETFATSDFVGLSNLMVDRKMLE